MELFWGCQKELEVGTSCCTGLKGWGNFDKNTKQRERRKSLLQESPQWSSGVPTPVFFSGKIPWTEEPGRLSPWGHEESDMT